MPSNISQFTKKNCAMMVMIGFSLNFIPSILIPLFVEESPVFATGKENRTAHKA